MNNINDKFIKTNSKYVYKIICTAEGEVIGYKIFKVNLKPNNVQTFEPYFDLAKEDVFDLASAILKIRRDEMNNETDKV